MLNKYYLVLKLLKKKKGLNPKEMDSPLGLCLMNIEQR